MRKVLLILLLIVTVITVSSCQDVNEPQDIVVVDMVGDEVSMLSNPSHVAVIARTAADMMIGFGLEDSIDGMYYSVLDNPWVSEIYPDSKDYYVYDYNESAELFLSRGVDLVLAPEQYIAEGLRESGVNAITVSLYGTPSYDDYLFYLADLIKQIWPRTENKVNHWKEELQGALDDVSSVLEEQNIAKRIIYYVRGDKDKGIGYTDTGYSLVESIYGTYLNMTYLGREFESNKPSAEEIMAKNPDVVVIGGIYQNKLIEQIRTEEPYKLLDAVTNNHIINIPIGFVMWEQNSVVLPLFVYDQANKLYPELFNFDIVQKTKDSYKYYFDYELSSDQVGYMLEGLSPIGEDMYSE